MLAFGPETPFLRGRHALLGEGVGNVGAGEQSAPVHPGSQVGGHGDVGRRGDDVPGERRIRTRDGVEDLAERGLGGDLTVVGCLHLSHRHGRCAEAPRALPEEGRGAQGCGGPRGDLPFRSGGDPHAPLPLRELRPGHQSGMVVLVPGERRAPALDRVGEEDGRLVGAVGRVEGGHERGEAVPAEVGHQGLELVVGAAFDQRRHFALVADLVQEALTPRRATPKGERGIERVGTGLDPAPKRRAAGLCEGRLLQRPMTQAHDAPAEGGEDRLDALPQPFAHHAVEGLAVVVDHPPAIAQVVLPALLQGFVDVALVEFRVAHEGHHAALGHVGLQVRFRVQVVLDHRREEGGRDAEADGAGREVDVVHVLGARGVALRATEAPEVLELFARDVAGEVLQRVKDRRGVRLDRDTVLRTQRVSVKGGHDLHHGGRRRLVSAHLHLPVLLGPQVVGVVDGPVRQPQGRLRDGLEVVVPAHAAITPAVRSRSARTSRSIRRSRCDGAARRNP